MTNFLKVPRHFLVFSQYPRIHFSIDVIFFQIPISSNLPLRHFGVIFSDPVIIIINCISYSRVQGEIDSSLDFFPIFFSLHFHMFIFCLCDNFTCLSMTITTRFSGSKQISSENMSPTCDYYSICYYLFKPLLSQ